MISQRTKELPSFYTQVIGSLPRPQLVRSLVDRRDSIAADEYSRIMDEMVIFAIRVQEQAGIDIIALSGYGRSEDQRRSVEAGFDAHMTKPFSLSALEKVLRRLRTE